MSYINDPRENTIYSENGYILEGDNRTEKMYNWSGKILDLCGLPVEEYMKPMTVIVLGGGGLPESGNTVIKEDVKIYFSVYRNGVAQARIADFR